ncbi:MAG TPA: GH3 auxin-responsive promoter family protein [Polyangiaceae bacterium]|nr:GH3 auxin-responsive promoter family protein [Polyangiaceae bacterium]
MTAEVTRASTYARNGAHRTPRERRELIGTGMPKAAGKALHALAHLRVWQWRQALWDVRTTQLKQLRTIVGLAAQTEFGRGHGFASIRNHADYARAVPLSDYDGHLPWLERMRTGESDILVPGFVENWGKSAGSSNRRREKILPITDLQVRHQQRGGMDVLAAYLMGSGDRSFTDGFGMSIFPSILQTHQDVIRMSSNPALMATRMPAISRRMTLPSRDLLVIADLEEKLTRIADRYLDHDVRSLMGTTCWFSVLFAKVLEAAQRRGDDVKTVSEIWPNLSVLFGGGVPADPYRPLIRRLFGRDLILLDTYNATEGGILAATDMSSGRAERGMTLVPHRGVFFEFVPVEDLGKPSPRRVPVWEVKKDQVYSIAVTTSSGLYAYQLGDFVRFTSVSPPRLEFAGRANGCLSLTQELMTQVELEDAVAAAVAAVPSVTVDWGVGADVGVDGTSKSRYVVFVEFAPDGAPSDLGAFGRAFDESLRKQNRAYREHRANDVAILLPRVVKVPQGTTKAFLSEVTRGNVQGKFPRILDEERVAIMERLVR